ncbi:hypothetical protein ACGF0D_10655 [Kitasatospora sp. NPDC048298]|uniref:hypothetical protein n=1 Tax=Kitasatospora sp. NPDC048298 TaxID=3364049 RepID=UPI00371F29BF
MSSTIMALGSGGAATVTTFVLFVGVRGKNKIQIDNEHVPYWAFGIGLLSANAGEAFQKIGVVGDNLARFEGSPALGGWQVGATAALATLAIFGLKARPWKDAILGAVAPSLYAAAGGLWAIPASIFTALISIVAS